MQTFLLENYLKELRLPTFAKNYKTLAERAQKNKQGYVEYLEELSEKEIGERAQKRIDRLIKSAQFPCLKTLETFEFDRVPELNPQHISSYAKGEWIQKHENIIAVGNSGMGKTHLSIALGILACHQGYSVLYKSVAQLSQELLEARDDKVLLKYKTRLAKVQLLILDELGYIPLTKEGAELLFNIFASRHETASILVTTNLPFKQWTEIFLCERLTGALLDRLTHQAHILQMNGESYRFSHTLQKKKS